ncbi:hypothetical protein GCK32_013513 [Trichostrongylus colubriformis]|uniref:Uncharacterized protein n=1 Tax=Trichostrongylus colubriformis TaxID=6319 RepID=A0AAN8F0F0_TRICO
MSNISLGTGSCSTLAALLRHELNGSTIFFLHILEWPDDHFTTEILHLAVKKQAFYISGEEPIVPVDDNILAQLTSPNFSIGSPNLITRDGLQLFIEALARGNQKVKRGVISTNFRLREIPLPKPSSIRTFIQREGYEIRIASVEK